MIPTSTFTRIRDVKSSFASSVLCSPIFLIITALPPVASMVEMAVTSWITGAVRLIAERAPVPIEKAALSLVCSVAGGVLNMVLDYVFIAGLDMGIGGRNKSGFPSPPGRTPGYPGV